ncbi:probable LRR receptor-like serine/threonine-protein kinase At3g47570 [Argentina anserina]|uniref:probable LRR receptor-like serine/threonine-protein kinase At3g47570 n=1 Tax=Argentina anserina TaxID=57926 RepID=UPI00217625EE|nr:probable LRR receptor-like serine/threonine-protein kinase At3g47570 [Potentilla anserina]
MRYFSSLNSEATLKLFGQSHGTLYPVNRPVGIVAVKVFNLSRWGVSNSFIIECEMFRNIRHRNIVKIIVTSCPSIDVRGNDFKALVYEFMPWHGSLEEWLHPRFGTQNPPKNLNLLQRLGIAIDVSCALDYLHNHCATPIVHCDIKPSNVLLDGQLTGLVSDFGLARFPSKPNTGSVGYVAPGKKASNQMFLNDRDLRTSIEMALPAGVKEIAYPRLFLQEDGHITRPLQECLSWIFGIGIVF